MTPRLHIPVLLQESVDALKLSDGAVAVDATVGEGGHAMEILGRLGGAGRVIGIEFDRRMLADLDVADPRLKAVEGNFRDIAGIVRSLGIDRVDAVLADLGLSTRHYRESAWGFSFEDGPLDMRLGSEGPTAADVVNGWPEKKLADWLLGAGVRVGRKIARVLVAERKRRRITRTAQLAKLVEDTVGGRRGRSHPATGVFRAIRQAVTGEIADLRSFIPGAAEILKPAGRIAILAYSSEEERVVRTEADRLVKGCICPPAFPVCRCGRLPSLTWIHRKAVRPGEDEIRGNPAARSAGLFVMEKI